MIENDNYEQFGLIKLIRDDIEYERYYYNNLRMRNTKMKHWAYDCKNYKGFYILLKTLTKKQYLHLKHHDKRANIRKVIR